MPPPPPAAAPAAPVCRPSASASVNPSQTINQVSVHQDRTDYHDHDIVEDDFTDAMSDGEGEDSFTESENCRARLPVAFPVRDVALPETSAPSESAPSVASSALYKSPRRLRPTNNVSFKRYF